MDGPRQKEMLKVLTISGKLLLVTIAAHIVMRFTPDSLRMIPQDTMYLYDYVFIFAVAASQRFIPQASPRKWILPTLLSVFVGFKLQPADVKDDVLILIFSVICYGALVMWVISTDNDLTGWGSRLEIAFYIGFALFFMCVILFDSYPRLVYLGVACLGLLYILFVLKSAECLQLMVKGEASDDPVQNAVFLYINFVVIFVLLRAIPSVSKSVESG